MSTALIQLGLFAAKTLIIFIFILLILISFFALLAKSKKEKGKLCVKNLNHKYNETAAILMSEALPKKDYKKFIKKIKADEKTKSQQKVKNIYVLNFHGDIRASGVNALSEEISAVLNVATEEDEVFLKLESTGGVVHGYGLAAAQLMRIRKRGIRLTIAIDKVAASGGYMMACIANSILAAPFAIIGSIGVIIQLPNFHRLLNDKHIDFEQLTAGEYKRTLTLFGENTEEGREKLQEEIEEIHDHFKNLITSYRQQIDINQVATGEHWLGEQALNMKLIDEIKTSDEYLLEKCNEAKLYEVCYEMKKPLLSRLTGSAKSIYENFRMKLFNS